MRPVVASMHPDELNEAIYCEYATEALKNLNCIVNENKEELFKFNVLLIS